MQPKVLIDRKCLLEKISGKGGWTYVALPEIIQDKTKPFGWVRVNGSVDGVEIKKYNLMPMGNGKLFLPVKLEIRKKIKKKEGDWVHVILYADDESLEIPKGFLLCLQDEPNTLTFFKTLTEDEQYKYIKWIYAAKTEQTKADRIVETLAKLSNGEKWG